MKRVSRYLIQFLAVVFLVTAYSAGTKATGVTESTSKYIEVCSNGIVYVPPHTKYVTCHGKVMRVKYIVRLDEKPMTLGDCFCPNCCGGGCAVIVSCEPQEESATRSDDCGCNKTGSTDGDLCFLYLSCGD